MRIGKTATTLIAAGALALSGLGAAPARADSAAAGDVLGALVGLFALGAIASAVDDKGDRPVRHIHRPAPPPVYYVVPPRPAPPRYAAPYRQPPRYAAPYREPPRYAAPYRQPPRYMAPHHAPPRYVAPSRVPPRHVAPRPVPPRHAGPGPKPPRHGAANDQRRPPTAACGPRTGRECGIYRDRRNGDRPRN